MLDADGPQVVVLGGAVMDIKAETSAPAVLHTSNPSTIRTTPGGVGRNIAEGLARLGRRTVLVAAIGDDAFGRELLAVSADAGVEVDHVVHSDLATGTYLAALDHDGELVIGASDMRATDALTVDDLPGAAGLLARADFLVVDGNIPASVTSWALGVAAEHDVPVLVEPVSVAKARRLARVLGAAAIDTITPNVDELAGLLGRPVADSPHAIGSAAAELHALGVRHVWVRRGPQGSLLSSDGVVTVLEAVPTRVVEVTGAGDAMTAAYVAARAEGEPPVDAARWGHLAAAVTIAHHATVRPDLATAIRTAATTPPRPTLATKPARTESPA